MQFDLMSLVKYILEGAAVAVAAYLLTHKRTSLHEVAMLGLVAAVTFLILDMFAPGVGAGTRQGAGFGLGFNLIGGPAMVAPAMAGGYYDQQGGYDQQMQQGGWQQPQQQGGWQQQQGGWEQQQM
jgi:ABC-type Co2+ transport system permease subunit